ncbi:MAG: hypothetical protein MI802_23910, partial [Desulfobacterales bacterium]|nr:hypothetical protein [Desulfobacterales bacterium]
IPIVYDALIVENIKLPELINTAIEAKLRQQQRYLEYQYKIKQAEAEIIRKKNEAIGIRQYQNIVKESLSPDLLKWKGIMATLDLAKSPNSKVVVVGGGEGGLPIIFNAEGALNRPANAHPAGFTTDMHKPGYQETDSHQTSGPDQNYGQDDEQKEPHGQEQSPPATPPYGSGDGQGGQNHMNQDRMPEDHQGQIRQGQLHGAATHDTRMHNDVSTSDVNTSDVSTSGPSGSERSGTSHSGFAQRAKDRLFKDFKGLMGGARPDADQTNTEKGGVHVQ